jgi:diguanylate cyclase (GGDEF)-like protein
MSNDNRVSQPGALLLNGFEQLKAGGDLPSPKGAALAMIRLTQKDSTSLADLTHAVKTDPAFAGRLIKSANCVRPVGRRPVASIQDALTILGIAAVRSLALSFSLLSGYRSGNCKKFDYKRYWSHSLVTAVALQALALRTRAAPADEAFSIGLLARVGELALATLYPDKFSRLLERASLDRGLQMPALEREMFAMTHGELTTAMLMDWGMPRIYTDPVFFFENPESANFAEGSRQAMLMHALSLADAIADVCLAADSERRNMMPRLFMLGSRLSIESEALSTLCDSIATDWAEWGALLNVEAASVPPFEEMSRPPDAPALGSDNLMPGGDSFYRMRMLVVDDDATMRKVLTTLLTQCGHEVFSANDGKQGFEMALDLNPQIMIVDWVMPEMDGIELTRSLRKTRIGRGIYILLLTGLEDEEKLVEAFDSGVDDFMVKPLKPRVLGARLRAGQRVIRLQQEIERDREEIRRFAAELAVTNRRLQEAALTDALTGFPNRRYAMERFQQEWSAVVRSGRPLSCMMVDLDAFKIVNDTYGHDVGDIVLKQVAAAIKGGLRGPDVVCRIGGDEFLVICPDTDREAALLCGERVRHAVEMQQIVAGGMYFKASISVGVATRDDSMADPDALIKMADRGAYQAKNHGRNQVATVQPAP